MRRLPLAFALGLAACEPFDTDGETFGSGGTEDGAAASSESGEPPAVDIDGVWSLDASCSDSCSPYVTVLSGSLTVEQDGTAITLTDGSGNVYTGTLANLELTFSLTEGQPDIGGTQTVGGSGNYIVGSDASSMTGQRLVQTTDVAGMTCMHTCDDTATR